MSRFIAVHPSDVWTVAAVRRLREVLGNDLAIRVDDRVPPRQAFVIDDSQMLTFNIGDVPEDEPDPSRDVQEGWT